MRRLTLYSSLAMTLWLVVGWPVTVEAAGVPSGSMTVQLVPTSSHGHEFILMNSQGQRVPYNGLKTVEWDGQTRTLDFVQGISAQQWHHALSSPPGTAGYTLSSIVNKASATLSSVNHDVTRGSSLLDSLLAEVGTSQGTMFVHTRTILTSAVNDVSTHLSSLKDTKTALTQEYRVASRQLDTYQTLQNDLTTWQSTLDPSSTWTAADVAKAETTGNALLQTSDLPYTLKVTTASGTLQAILTSTKTDQASLHWNPLTDALPQPIADQIAAAQHTTVMAEQELASTDGLLSEAADQKSMLEQSIEELRQAARSSEFSDDTTKSISKIEEDLASDGGLKSLAESLPAGAETLGKALTYGEYVGWGFTAIQLLYGLVQAQQQMDEGHIGQAVADYAWKAGLPMFEQIGPQAILPVLSSALIDYGLDTLGTLVADGVGLLTAFAVDAALNDPGFQHGLDHLVNWAWHHTGGLFNLGNLQSNQNLVYAPDLFLWSRHSQAFRVTASDPSHIVHSAIPLNHGQWVGIAKPGGSLELFGRWSTHTIQYTVNTNTPHFQPQGWVIPRADFASWATATFTQMGWPAPIAQAFIRYWTPRLPRSPWIGIQSAPSIWINNVDPLKISPDPQAFARFWVVWYPMRHAAQWTIPKLTMTHPQRWTAYEWGGLYGSMEGDSR